MPRKPPKTRPPTDLPAKRRPARAEFPQLELSSFEVQRLEVEEAIRGAIAAAVMDPNLNGHTAFSRILTTIIGHTLAGNITPEQAQAITPLCELLFTNLTAQLLAEERASLKGSDPMAMVAKAAAAAQKTNPLPLVDQSQLQPLDIVQSEDAQKSLAAQLAELGALPDEETE